MNIKENLDYCLNCKTKPCQNKCPLNNDIPEVIALMKQNKYEEAYSVLTKTTVLSSVEFAHILSSAKVVAQGG